MGVILVAGFSLASAAAVAAPAADWAEVTGRGTLRVLMVDVDDSDEFLRASLPADPGFDGEVLQGFVALHKLRLEVVRQSSWDALIPALLQSKGDLVAGRFTVTDARQKRVAFTSEVFPTRSVVLTRRPTPAVASLDELRALKVGTIRGTSMAEAIAAAGLPKGNVVDTIAPGGLPAALRKGQVAAAVLGLESAIAAQRQDADIQLGVFLGPPGSLAYAVRKEDAELLRLLNQYIENLRHSPTWNRLVVKYFGEAAPQILKRARTE